MWTLLSQRYQRCDSDMDKTMKIFTSKHRHTSFQLAFFFPPRIQVKLKSLEIATFFFFLFCYRKLMNSLQPIRIACNNVEYDLQSRHMHTAITVMKMNIIVEPRMKMVCRLLPADPTVSSLWHRAKSKIEGNAGEQYLKGEKRRKGKMRRGVKGGLSINIIVKYIQSQTEKCPKTCWSVSTWVATLISLHPFRITFIAGVLVHKVFHGWNLTASDAKNPSSNAIYHRGSWEDGEIIQNQSEF